MSSVAQAHPEHAQDLRESMFAGSVPAYFQFFHTLHSFNISHGSFSATVPARSAIAIHVNAKGTGSGSGGSETVAVTFNENANTTFGEVLVMFTSTTAH
jgi:hypothetical protein